jgi:hypothetical protein
MRLSPPAPALALLLAIPLAAQEAPAPEAPPAETPAPAAEPPAAASRAEPAPAKARPAPRATPPAGSATSTTATPTPRPPAAVPLNERTAVLGVLDKRLGTTAEFTLKPGERFRFGRLSGILRSCERTQPHERPQSGAFVQVAETPTPRQGQPAPQPRLVFSGWIFAESPSLNPFQHPVYDVWLKSCTMRFPDAPPIPKAPAGKKGAKPRPAAKTEG